MAADQTVVPPMTTRDVVSEIHQPDGLIPVTPESVSQLVLEVKRLTSALEAKDAEIARLTVCLSNSEDQFQAKIGEVIAQMDRISDLERQLAEEPTKAMVDAGVAFALNVTLSGEYRWSQYVADLFKTMRAAAIREGAK